MKNIQVFTKPGGDFCEVNGDLVSIEYGDGYVVIKSREEGDKHVWENHFPLSQIKLIRISSNA